MSKFIEFNGKKFECRGKRLVPEFTLKPLKGGNYRLQRRLSGRASLVEKYEKSIAGKKRQSRIAEIFPRTRQPKSEIKKIQKVKLNLPKAQASATGIYCPWPNCGWRNPFFNPGRNTCARCGNEFEVVNYIKARYF